MVANGTILVDGRFNPRSREALKPRDWDLDFPIALKFGKHRDSSAVEMPVKFQSDKIIIASNLAASRLHEIWRREFRPVRIPSAK